MPDRTALLVNVEATVAAAIVGKLEQQGYSVFIGSDLNEVVQQHGGIDALIYGFQPLVGDDLIDTDSAEIDTALDRLLAEPFWTAQRAARQMEAQGRGGRIVFLLSAGVFRVLPHSLLLDVAHSALETAAKVAAVELGPARITVNCVARGWLEGEPWPPVDPEALPRGTPLGRPASPREIAAACGFLCSAEADYVTGITLRVDGGLMITKGA